MFRNRTGGARDSRNLISELQILCNSHYTIAPK